MNQRHVAVAQRLRQRFDRTVRQSAGKGPLQRRHGLRKHLLHTVD
jgi:hypothetical protein